MSLEEGFDTIVVPAKEAGFTDLFLRLGCWYPIRIHASRYHRIKYIAIYRVAPLSAITHIAPVKRLVQWSTTEKFKVLLSGCAQEIGPVKLVRGGKVKALQSARYTTVSKLESSKTLDDLWG